MPISGADLRVDKSKLNLLKLDFELSSESIADLNSSIFSAVEGMGAGWSGPDYEEFVNYFERYRSTLDGIAATFDVYTAKIKEFEDQGDILISAVQSALNLAATKVQNSFTAWSLKDTSEIKEATVAYAVSPEPATAKEARLAAENARDNIYADMELLQQELRTIDINKMALEKQREILGEAEYARLYKELVEHENNVIETLNTYSEVYGYVCNETKRKFWPWSKDGSFVEASDGWFWTENDRDTAAEAAKALNDELAKLPPVTTVIDSAAVNGLLTYGDDDYLLNNFYNGSSVSPTMLEAARIIGENAGETASKELSNGNQLILYNSRAMIQSGYTDENDEYRYLHGEDGTYTFGQDQAYGAYYGEDATTIDGYDSVAIKDKNGKIVDYMTAEQYQRRCMDDE